MTLVRMPQKGLTEESAILARWYVKKGDRVKEGDYLFAIETGKATFEIESESAGLVLETFGGEGDEIPIKTVVCAVGEEGEVYRPEKAETVSEKEAAGAAPDTPGIASSASKRADTRQRVRISPRARRLAEQKHVDITQVSPTGPGGRIVESDIREAARQGAAQRPAEPVSASAATGTPPPAAPAAGGNEDAFAFEAVPNSTTRQTIARNMCDSLGGMAQFTMTAAFDASALLGYRKTLKRQGAEAGLGDITLGDMVVFGVSRTILGFPDLNAHYSDREIRRFRHAHLGVAVDTPRGVMVPTVFCADTCSLSEISSEIKRLAGQCTSGAADPQAMSGGTFTVSNLGAWGILSFTPIINPPQTAILGVGAVEYRQKMAGEELVTYPAMTLSLTIDHRAVDGAPGARFLQALCKNLEQFTCLLAK